MADNRTQEFKSGHMVQLRGDPTKIGVVISRTADDEVVVEWPDMKLERIKSEKVERWLRPGEIK